MYNHINWPVAMEGGNCLEILILVRECLISSYVLKVQMGSQNDLLHTKLTVTIKV